MNIHEMMFPNAGMGGPAAIMPAPGMMPNVNMGASNMAPMGGMPNQMAGGMGQMGGGMNQMGGGMNQMGGGMGQFPMGQNPGF